MSTAGHTPNFIAEEAIYPFRCVMVGSAPFKAVQSTSNPEILLGVTDGSVQGFRSNLNADVGQPISLQNGEFVQLTAGGSIAVGDTLIATTDGKVEASVSATEYIAQAAENANDGEIFWAKKIGAWTVGGGSPFVGGMTVDVQEFDDPESEDNVWTKPLGAQMVFITMCGGGQDGQDGPIGEEPGGPTGGGAGRYAEKAFSADDLPSTLTIQVGLHRPWASGPSTDFCSYVYDGMTPIAVANSGGYTGLNYGYPSGGSASGLSPWQSTGENVWNFGNGAYTVDGFQDGNVGWGPGGGGGGGSYEFDNNDGGDGGAGGAPALNEFGQIARGGGGAGGIAAVGSTPGTNGGNGTIDSHSGFGGGGGGGGNGGDPGVGAGNGGNGVRGGGGGGGGGHYYGLGGFGGQGGDGYVRITTICFN